MAARFGTPARAAQEPVQMVALPPEPEALPDDIAAAARRLWAQGRARDALALVYRGSVEAMGRQGLGRTPAGCDRGAVPARVPASAAGRHAGAVRRGGPRVAVRGLCGTIAGAGRVRGAAGCGQPAVGVAAMRPAMRSWLLGTLLVLATGAVIAAGMALVPAYPRAGRTPGAAAAARRGGLESAVRIARNAARRRRGGGNAAAPATGPLHRQARRYRAAVRRRRRTVGSGGGRAIAGLGRHGRAPAVAHAATGPGR